MLNNLKVILLVFYYIILVIKIVIFFKTLVDKKKDEVKFKIIPKTNEEYISLTYGCTELVDSYRFLSNSLDIVETLVDDSHKSLKIVKKEILDDNI